MCKILDKIKKLFGKKSTCEPCAEKKDESKPAQEELKPEQEEPKPEQKQ